MAFAISSAKIKEALSSASKIKVTRKIHCEDVATVLKLTVQHEEWQYDTVRAFATATIAKVSESREDGTTVSGELAPKMAAMLVRLSMDGDADVAQDNDVGANRLNGAAAHA